MPRTKTRAAVSQPLVSLNLTAEQFEALLESAACSLRTEIPRGLKLDGAELLAAAEEQLSADAIRASGQRYLAAAERPENAERAEHIRELGTEKLEEAEELAEFYAEAIGLYRALLAQAPQLVA